MTAMIKNVLLISADFPTSYCQFAEAFKKNGCCVLVIGSTPANGIEPKLRESVTEYVQCTEMENVSSMINTVDYLIKKYGPIDFLESNNEYWLHNDAILREWFDIESGIFPRQLEDYQRKSVMKKAFIEAGAKHAPFIIAKSYEQVLEFVQKYHYPIFAKPDIGVGAASNYKIDSDDDLRTFFNEKPNVDYIVEPFVKGRIVTFDGIADSDSNTVITINEIFPKEIFNLHKTKDEMFYYTNIEVPKELLEVGKKIIKALKLKNRFFHTEFFLAENEIPGSFKVGDYVAIEVNIRTPGGFTPDLLNIGIDSNVYQIYADVICFGKTDIKIEKRYFAACASRRDIHKYFFSDEDIFRTFKKEMCRSGRYPKVLSDLMGDQYYMARFETVEDVHLFEEYTKRKVEPLHHESEKISHVVGEDRRMLRENKQDMSDSSDLTICDKHIDGA